MTAETPNRIRPRWADVSSEVSAAAGPPGPDEFLVIVHAAGQLDDAQTAGYWTEVPALSACSSEGRTLTEAVDHTRTTIQAWLRKRRQPEVDVRLRVDLAY